MKQSDDSIWVESAIVLFFVDDRCPANIAISATELILHKANTFMLFKMAEASVDSV